MRIDTEVEVALQDVHDLSYHHEGVKQIERESKHINFGKGMLCSQGFLFIYTALYSAQNIQTILFQDDNLG